jgi:cell division protein FtsB
MRAPRLLGLVLGSIGLAAVLFLFVLPSRTYLAQRHSLSAVETQLQVFRAQNAKLAAEAAQLQSDADIERIARQDYGLVKPGEKAYVIQPAAPAPAVPSVAKRAARPGLVERVWHDIQFWN